MIVWTDNDREYDGKMYWNFYINLRFSKMLVDIESRDGYRLLYRKLVTRFYWLRSRPRCWSFLSPLRQVLHLSINTDGHFHSAGATFLHISWRELLYIDSRCWILARTVVPASNHILWLEWICLRIAPSSSQIFPPSIRFKFWRCVRAQVNDLEIWN